MKVSNVVLNAMLDNQLHGATTSLTYQLVLLVDVTYPYPTETIEFVQSVNGVTQLSSSVFFAVEAGNEVLGIQVIDSNEDILLEEGVTGEVYVENGTFTVNNIIITLTAN